MDWLRDGVYSEFDSAILYDIVKNEQPQTIVELSPGQGRTTSCIVNAIDKADNYYLFEKDMTCVDNIMSYLDGFDNCKFTIGTNVIDSPVLKEIGDIDFLLIDSNHDYILAKWYVNNLFPLVKVGGIIHVHDIYYNVDGNGWDDVGFKAEKPFHPDLANPNVIKSYYPTCYETYRESMDVTLMEGDIIRRFYDKYKFNFLSTSDITYRLNLKHKVDPTGLLPHSCSIYFNVDRKIEKEIK